MRPITITAPSTGWIARVFRTRKNRPFGPSISSAEKDGFVIKQWPESTRIGTRPQRKVTRQMTIFVKYVTTPALEQMSNSELRHIINAASEEITKQEAIVFEAADILCDRYQDEELNRHLDGGFSLNGEAQ